MKEFFMGTLLCKLDAIATATCKILNPYEIL